jgi:hypothetical protein
VCATCPPLGRERRRRPGHACASCWKSELCLGLEQDAVVRVDAEATREIAVDAAGHPAKLIAPHRSKATMADAELTPLMTWGVAVRDVWTRLSKRASLDVRCIRAISQKSGQMGCAFRIPTPIRLHYPRIPARNGRVIPSRPSCCTRTSTGLVLVTVQPGSTAIHVPSFS